MKGVNGKNGEEPVVPRGTRLWFQLGRSLDIPLDSLVDWWINQWRGVYKTPKYWWRGRQQLREAMLRNKAEEAMESEKILETVEVREKVMEVDSKKEKQTDTDNVEDANIQRKISSSKRWLVAEDDKNIKYNKEESQTENNNLAQNTPDNKIKSGFPIKIPPHVTVLPGKPPRYQCSICQKTFKTKPHVKYHSFCNKSQNNPKPFQCPICDRGFISKYHYQYHLLTHKNQRPFKCIYCNKGFIQRGKLNRHLRGHNGKQPYMCPEYPRCFASNHALKSQVKTQKVKEIRNGNFECVHCEKAFRLKFYRDQHSRRVHLGKRQHACNLCTRSFFVRKDLVRHLLTHTDKQPFQCRICDRRFKRKDNLQRHIRNNHGVPKENVADQVVIQAITSN